jgi:hypothetical protein
MLDGNLKKVVASAPAFCGNALPPRRVDPSRAHARRRAAVPEASRRTVDKNDIGRVKSIGIHVPIWSPFRALGSHLT